MTAHTTVRRRGRPPGHRIDPGRMTALCRAALDGDSLPAIGRRIGVTRQRAGQLLVEAGLHAAWAQARGVTTQRRRFRRIVSGRRSDVQALLCEASGLGLEVTCESGTLLVEGLYVRVLPVRAAWKCPTAAPEHPGYYRWRRGSLGALYVVVFPGGGRRFLLPPHARESHRYLRADDPSVRVREPWPAAEVLRAAAEAVVGMRRQGQREGEAA